MCFRSTVLRFAYCMLPYYHRNQAYNTMLPVMKHRIFAGRRIVTVIVITYPVHAGTAILTLAGRVVCVHALFGTMPGHHHWPAACLAALRVKHPVFSGSDNLQTECHAGSRCMLLGLWCVACDACLSQ